MQAERETEKTIRLQLEAPLDRTESGWRDRANWLFKAASGGGIGPGRRGRLRRGAEGQALVEFALTLPFLILLFVVLVELGLLIRSHMTVTSTVREGVRLVSARGNADPSALVASNGVVYGGNDVNTRVGQDADTVLVQNVNTSLQQESQNVTLLMTYRADATEVDPVSGRPSDPISNTQVATQIGKYGIGGAYGVFYNPALSLQPFQEIFDYTVTRTVPSNPSSPNKKVFLPNVMSSIRCNSIYGSDAVAKPTVPNLAGQSYGGAAFCGDGSKTDDSGTTGVNRAVALGQVSGSITQNATMIYGKLPYPGSPKTCQPDPAKSNAVPYVPPTSAATATAGYAIQCWRYNFTPWYPALRRASDVGLSAQINPANPGYYNNQFENAAYFGLDNPPSGTENRAPDYIGVQIVYNHSWFLQFFPGQLTLSDKAVKVMEPVGGNFQQPQPATPPSP